MVFNMSVFEVENETREEVRGCHDQERNGFKEASRRHPRLPPSPVPLLKPIPWLIVFLTLYWKHLPLYVFWPFLTIHRGDYRAEAINILESQAK